ncbi:MAG: toxin-antitoxin system HicB family antitoxin [Sphingomonas sp.]|uniref:toxin-antitoxin system HicB family antitoxin n=1 Tax=Sphingomonas sp. TaxID=28214 RepID=UPI0025EC17BD|nr:toxin-antitoxin system HicB family antitoxin [Sphingomonas sp.]MBY0284718.1 toxin-antitoxin system HicB family antitoxin [Sphingomonas sp.]
MAEPLPKKAFALRLDPALFAAIERSAAGDLRSVNAQVECLLREALARRGVKLAAPVAAKRGRPPRETSNAE